MCGRMQWCVQSTRCTPSLGLSILTTHPPHPLLQATYTGVRTTVIGNIIFPSFLAKTKREQALLGHIHGKFWPHSLQFGLWFFTLFLVKFRDIVWKHLQSWTGFDLPIVLGVKFWWFFFCFTSSLGPLEPEYALFKDLEEIGKILEISEKSEISGKSIRN